MGREVAGAQSLELTTPIVILSLVERLKNAYKKPYTNPLQKKLLNPKLLGFLTECQRFNYRSVPSEVETRTQLGSRLECGSTWFRVSGLGV